MFDLIIVSIYNSFDFLGVYIFVLVFASIFGIMYYYVLKKIINNDIVAFFITLITIYFMRAEFTARAQVISSVLILSTFYLLEQIKIKSEKKYIIALLVIPIVLANIHSSVFPMYFVIYLPYIAEYIVSKIPFNKYSKFIFATQNIKIFMALFFVTISAGLFTTTGLASYTDMFKAMSGISTSFIAELLPISIFEETYFSIILFASIAILIFTPVKIRVSDSLFILGFAILALSTSRCIYYFYSISSICFMRLFIDFIRYYDFNFQFINNKIKSVAMFLAIVLVFINSIRYWINSYNQNYVDYVYYPISAANYILDNIDISKMKIFNHFNFGSYLEFRGIPAFIDSRSGIFTEQFNEGCTILEDWKNVSSGVDNYNNIFDKYEITHVLLYQTEVISQYIKYDKKWRLIQQDDSFCLYERVLDS